MDNSEGSIAFKIKSEELIIKDEVDDSAYELATTEENNDSSEVQRQFVIIKPDIEPPHHIFDRFNNILIKVDSSVCCNEDLNKMLTCYVGLVNLPENVVSSKMQTDSENQDENEVSNSTIHDQAKHKCDTSKTRPYKCKECRKWFTQKGNLTMHMLTHEGYSVNTILKTMDNSDDLNSVEVKIESDELIIKDECDYTTGELETTEENSDLIDVPKQFVIIESDVGPPHHIFDRFSNTMIKVDASICSTEDLNKILTCYVGLVNLPENLASSKMQIDSENQDGNEVSNSTIHDLAKHKCNTSETRRYICKECQKWFTQKGNLTMHMLTHEGYSVNTILKTMDNSDDLNSVEVKIESDELIIKDECDYTTGELETTKENSDLIDVPKQFVIVESDVGPPHHIFDRFSNTMIKVNAASICSTEDLNKILTCYVGLVNLPENLASSKMQIDSENQDGNEVSNSTINDLAKHKCNTSKTRRYICKECQKWFTRKGNLTMHMLTHEGYSVNTILKTMDNSDDLNSVEVKIESDELIIKDECDYTTGELETTEENSDLIDVSKQFVIINTDVGPPHHIFDRFSNTMIKVNAASIYSTEELNKILTCYVGLVNLPENLASSKMQIDSENQDGNEVSNSTIHDLAKHKCNTSETRRYICKECQKWFTQNGNLTMHMLTHEGYSVNTILKTMDNSDDLNSVEVKIESDELIIKDECDYTTGELETAEENSDLIDVSKQFVIINTGVGPPHHIFDRFSNTMIKVNAASICSTEDLNKILTCYVGLVNLPENLASSKMQIDSENQDGNEVSNSTINYLAKHKCNNSKTRRYICKECQKWFTRKGNLTMHMLTHEGYSVNTILKTMENSDDLNSVEVKIESDELIIKDECDYTTGELETTEENSDLIDVPKQFVIVESDVGPPHHIFDRFSNTMIKVNAASICSTEDLNKILTCYVGLVNLPENLASSKMQIDSENQDGNEVSNSTINDLAKHKCNTSKTRRYICKECQKWFTRKGNLTMHMLTHEGYSVNTILKTMDNSDDLNSVEVKIESDELIIKDECDYTTGELETTEENSDLIDVPKQFVIVESDVGPPHHIFDRFSNTMIKVNAASICSTEDLNKILTCYVGLVNLPENLASSKMQIDSENQDGNEVSNSTINDLAKHKCNTSKTRRYICKECQKWFTRKGNLTMHMLTHEGYSVNTILKTMDNSDDLNSVEVKIESDELIIKDECYYTTGELETTKENSDLIDVAKQFVIIKSDVGPPHHIFDRFSNTMIKVDASICSTEDLHKILTCYVGLVNLPENLASSKMQNNSENQDGNKVSNSTIHDHTKHKCDTNKTRPYKCQKCQKQFTQKGTFTVHMLMHKDKRPYKCQECEKSFTQSLLLARHMLIHKGKKCYKCENCQNRFTLYSALRRHMLIHKGKETHKCKECQKQFTRKSVLTDHMLMHEVKKS